MTGIETVKKLMAKNKRKYCEFIMCLVNSGNADIKYHNNEKHEFCYRRNFENLGFSDMFIGNCTRQYVYQMLNEMVLENTGVVSILPASQECGEELANEKTFQSYCSQNGWDIKFRYQFYKSDSAYNQGGVVKLNPIHKPLIEKSESDRVKQYYALSMQGGGESYGIIENNGLISYLSVVKLSNREFPLAEVNWIYTESLFRKQNFAANLLQSVCSILIKEGYTVS